MSRIMALAGVIVLVAGLSNTVFPQNIYTWTDAHGTRRFSSEPPPDGIKKFTVTDEIESDPAAMKKARQEYDKMIRQVQAENRDRARKEAEQNAKDSEIEKKKQVAEQRQRILAEQNRLQREMDAITQRGLSTTFGPGQKAAMIEEIKKKKDLLEKDPNAYFSR
ncbi:DUF4124 domain-containing protein [Desulfosarcina sp. OttesenSCG-928-A07]|nr:DUF4124 domain-containing protein [Desulfosarcina sp. OttesenSCG-928-G17]MDL2328281.1 DUF4124 domain-containing protein [Desulfosarcina sp. OttesenSCG-928-A07]